MARPKKPGAKKYSFRLTIKYVEKLNAIAAADRRSLTDYLDILIEKTVNEYEATHKPPSTESNTAAA